MTHWKTTLSYDGTTFHGWQVQPHLATIQGTLAAALHQVTGETILPQGSGRTDSGVHALAQVTSFTTTGPIPAANLLRALNHDLPPSIRILSVEPVPETFHARHSARGKTYEYRIFQRRPNLIPTAPPTSEITPDLICSPFLAPYVWNCHWPLNLEAMHQSAALLLGTHDFTSFAASDPDLAQREALSRPKQHEAPTELSSRPEHRAFARHSGETPAFEGLDATSTSHHPSNKSNPNPSTFGVISPGNERYPKALALGLIPPAEERGLSPGSGPNPTKTLTQSTLTLENDLLIYRITGSGFLHHMVRNIVGTLVEVGRGALTPSDIPRILAAQDRTTAGPTAPATGLFLHTVHYTPNN